MIAIIGDVMLDEYVFSSSIRQSPECSTAPVAVIHDTTRYIGGAGNTALNILHLEGQPKLFCSVSHKGAIRQLIGESNLPSETTFNLNNDIVKTRVYINGQYVARLDKEDKIKHDEQFLVSSAFKNKPDMIVISDYGKGTITNPQEIIRRARLEGIPVLVDSKSNLSDFKGASVLKPNLKEFFEWSGMTMPDNINDSVNKLTQKILQDAVDCLQVDNLIVTVGELGCIHASIGIINMHPALPIKAVDVTGAGDTFIAALAVAMSEGKTIKRAIQFANKAASIAVTKKGTQYVGRNEI